MDKIDSLNQTADFHKLFNHPILEEPTIPEDILRSSLNPLPSG